MYESYYKLNPTPFRLTPDPHFFFESETHKRGLAYLRFAFYQREGFVIITGAPGTGKTELMLNLIRELPHHKVTLAKIVTSNLDADDFLDLVAASFGIDPEHISKGSLLKKLEEYFLRQTQMGKQVLLFVDEAHNLSVRSLVELSMLSNFQIDEKPVMQCFLLGHQPLEDKLGLPELAPLKQRVIASTRLENLDKQETRAYILHRLVKSGWNNNPVFHDAAFSLIHQYTSGVPRKINSLCNRLFLHSFLENQHVIDADSVHVVVDEIQEEAVSEPIDLDFATLQTNLDSSDSIPDNDKQVDHNDEHSSDNPRQVLPETVMSWQQEMIHHEMDTKPAVENIADVPAFIKSREGQHLDLQKDNTFHSEPNRTTAVENKNLKRANSSDTIDIDSTRNAFQEIYLTAVDSTGAVHKTKASRAIDSAREDAAIKLVDRPRAKIYNNGPTVRPAVIKPATRTPVNRPSGLLDKQLQFLSSHSATLKTSVKSAVETGPEIERTHEKAEQAATNTPKVIIDESAYDDYELDSAETNESWLEYDSTSSPVKRDRRQIAMVTAVLVTLVISIGWLYNGDSGTVKQVAESQSTGSATVGESVTENKVFSDDAAETSTAASLAQPSDPGQKLASEPDIAPVDIELPVITQSDTPTDVTAIESSSSTTSSTTGSKPLSDKLDQKINQIVEKYRAKNKTTADITTLDSTQKPEKSIHQDTNTKLAATPSNKPVITPATTNGSSSKVSVADRNSRDTVVNRQKMSETSVVMNKPQAPLPDKATMVTKKPTSRTAAPGNSVSDSPLIGSPLGKPSNLAVTSDPALTRRSLTTNTSAVENSSSNAAFDAAAPVISQADLNILLSRLSAAYETGNLQQLVTTFATDINDSEGSNRRQILQEYQRLFNITDKRQLTIRDVVWSPKDKQMLGKGDFEVLIREKGATKYTKYEGKISFAVAKQSNAVVIKKLDYDYGQ